MEKDDLVQDLNNAELGLGKSSCQSGLKSRSRAKTMDGGEKKSESRKRVKSVGVGIGSDDDEPIGSLFKLKRRKNSKNGKLGLENRRVQKVEVKEEMAVVVEDLGGMDDTLASFKKKLKGPKKDSGSGNVKERGLALDGTIRECGVLDGRFEEGDVTGQGISEDASDVNTAKGVKTLSNRRVKRTMIDSNVGKVGSILSNNDDAVALGSVGPSMVNLQEVGEGSKYSLDVKIEDSLPGAFRKSSSSYSLKQNSCEKNLEEGCKPSCIAVDSGLSGSAKRSQHVSDNKVSRKNKKKDGSMNRSFDLCTLGPTVEQLKVNQPVVDTCGSGSQEEPILCPRCSNQHFERDGERHDCLQFKSDHSVVVGSLADDVSVSEIVEHLLPLKGTKELYSTELEPNIDFSDVPIISSSSIAKEVVVSCSKDDELAETPFKMKSEEVHYLSSEAEAAKLEADILSNKCLKDSLPMECAVGNLSTNSMETTKAGGDYDDLDVTKGEPEEVAVFSGKAKDGFPSTTETACDLEESGFAFRKCKTGLNQNQSSDASRGVLSVNEIADGDSPSSEKSDESGDLPEDAVSIPDSENRDSKLSAVQRVMRIPKKRRHGDMAYEGDVDWDLLINEQGFLDSHRVSDYDRSLRTRDRIDSSLSILLEDETCGAAAVSAGLKVRAACLLEKIKFKDVMKRRGGLQEYLECRLVTDCNVVY